MPPVSGKIVPISATVKPPAIAITPPNTHANRPNPGEPAAPYTAVGLKKMPAPNNRSYHDGKRG